ncbi:MAG: biotin--[acetyl-CoA-carboxylase] ligase [Caldimonas sp.]
MGAAHWNAAALGSQLDRLWPGLAVEIVDATGSTNTDLVERARAAAGAARPEDGVSVRRSVESAAFGAAPSFDTADARPDEPHFTPCLRVAEQQNGGRGRQGRSWLSERGASLTFSLALPLVRTDLSGLSLAIGVALADALEPRAARPRIGLKWPNDLWLLDAPGRGRKLGGVLIETVPLGRQRIAVIGVGLNVLALAQPADVASGYAGLHELDPEATAPALLERVAAPLVDAVRTFERAGFAPFRERYAARDLLSAQRVRTTQPDLPEGLAAGIDADGALVVERPDGRFVRVSSGEVSVRLGGPPAKTPC